jgi:AraC family transcriptional regulator
LAFIFHHSTPNLLRKPAVSTKPHSRRQRAEYVKRINRVLDYISQNLSEPLSLEKLAEIACLSPFHFHRIFGAMMGETINQYVQRIRLERSAQQLCMLPDMPITEIAQNAGFSGSASFARAFSKRFGMSASQWRNGGYKQYGKMSKTESNSGEKERNPWKEATITPVYLDPDTYKPTWRIKMIDRKSIKIEVKDLPEKHYAYVRHIGPYAGDEDLFRRLFNQLITWAAPRGLFQPPETEMLSIYHDNPGLTDENKLRTDVCITVPADTVVEGEVGKGSIPAGQFAMARFEINADEYGEAWDIVYGEWLPESGYQPDERGACFELYGSSPDEHPEGKHVFDLCLMVKPL